MLFSMVLIQGFSFLTFLLGYHVLLFLNRVSADLEKMMLSLGLFSNFSESLSEFLSLFDLKKLNNGAVCLPVLSPLEHLKFF